MDQRRTEPIAGRRMSSRLPAYPRAIFLGVVVVAGVAGLLLVSWPGSTGRLFAWPLGPPALAAIVGGLYLGSSLAFAIAAAGSWRAARGLAVASIAFTAPTFVATLVHLELFDFSRFLALDWVAVFAVAPVLFAWILIANPVPEGATLPRLPMWLRAALVALAIAFFAGAVWLWIDPPSAHAWLPLVPRALGGRFLGSWMAMIAVLFGWASVRPADEGRTVLFQASAFLAGALVGAIRGFEGLDPGGRIAFLVVLAGLSGTALLAGIRGPAARRSA